MSPIDRELEQALTSRAADLVPPGDLLAGVEQEARGIRRRRGVLTGAAALSVLAIAVAVPLATRDSSPGTRGGFGAPPTPTPAETLHTSPGGRLGYGLARGTTSPGVAERAFAAWRANHPSTFSEHRIFGTTLPDRRRVEVFEAYEARRSFVVFYVEDESGTGGRIVQGLELGEFPIRQVSAHIDGPAVPYEDYVLVVGAPTTSQLEFSTDEQRYTTVSTDEGAGLVAVTKGEDRTAYRVRLYDESGTVVYDGPIDLLSED